MHIYHSFQFAGGVMASHRIATDTRWDPSSDFDLFGVLFWLRGRLLAVFVRQGETKKLQRRGFGQNSIIILNELSEAIRCDDILHEVNGNSQPVQKGEIVWASLCHVPFFRRLQHTEGRKNDFFASGPSAKEVPVAATH